MSHHLISLEGIPDEPGLYALFKEGKLIYIGTTQTLRTRISSHRSGMCRDGRGDEVRWVVIKDTHSRISMEKWLIRKHEPGMNRRDNSKHEEEARTMRIEERRRKYEAFRAAEEIKRAKRKEAYQKRKAALAQSRGEAK